MSDKTIPERYAEAADEAAFMVLSEGPLSHGLATKMVEKEYAVLAAEHEALYDATRWRDANREKPDPMPDHKDGLWQSRLVMVWCPEWRNPYQPGRYWRQTNVWSLEGSAGTFAVTHWRPLPPAPAEPDTKGAEHVTP